MTTPEKSADQRRLRWVGLVWPAGGRSVPVTPPAAESAPGAATTPADQPPQAAGRGRRRGHWLPWQRARRQLDDLAAGPLADEATLLALARDCEAGTPVFAAAFRQQARNIRIAVELLTGESPKGAGREQLFVHGGHEPLSTVPITDRARYATVLKATADRLDTSHRRLVWRMLRTPRGRSQALYGPGSLLGVAAWCRTVAYWLDASQAPDTRRPVARFTGAVSGAVTPLAVWWTVRAGTKTVLWAARSPVAWLAVALLWRYRDQVWQHVAKSVDWLVWRAPMKWPHVTEALLRHTLAWWQGYAHGWNATRVVWQVVAPQVFTTGAVVPRMPVAQTMADLNAGIINVGQQFKSLLDDAPVIHGSPRVVPTDGVVLSLPELSSMTDAIMVPPVSAGGRPNEEQGSIRIAHSARSGAHQLVVLIPGTQTMSLQMVKNPFTLGQNVHLLAFGVASTAHSIRTTIEAEVRRLRIGPAEPVNIMLFGHSQGGLLATQLVRNRLLPSQFRVTHVVTTGAPIAGREFPPHVQFLAVEHVEDMIAKLDLTDNPRESNVVTVKSVVTTGDEPSRVMDVHRWFKYRETLELIESNDHPALVSFCQQISDFLGPVDSIVDYPQRRML